jgi:hypothetical protein
MESSLTGDTYETTLALLNGGKSYAVGDVLLILYYGYMWNITVDSVDSKTGAILAFTADTVNTILNLNGSFPAVGGSGYSAKFSMTSTPTVAVT